ncbi:MAG: DUF2252 domain-containing protein [Acidobacteriota bacterium]|nr:DUF2252 domain-containing protein [Acidobacteriota bacterium]
MTFSDATASYESWLGQELEIIPADLAMKHQAMRTAIFPFFRATFYRWAQIWPKVCPQCAKAPAVLAAGDLHVENFGTWRDAEGRLVWGINDFDEICRMPYTMDLVRLAASAHLAIDSEQLHVPHRDACDAILAGYRESLAAGGLPWVLGGKHAWLYEMVKPGLRDPAVFWQKLESLPPLTGHIPGNARRGLEKAMPGKTSKWRVAHRVAGMGSLGRQRFVALAEYKGALVCREARALAPSAWHWAREDSKSGIQSIRYQRALDIAVRDADPFVRLQGSWIVRRLAPDCIKVNLAMFPRERDETRLLHAMGWETANLHLGSGNIERITADLAKRPPHWLHKAAAKMVSATKKDWKEWQAGSGTAAHASMKT